MNPVINLLANLEPENQNLKEELNNMTPEQLAKQLENHYGDNIPVEDLKNQGIGVRVKHFRYVDKKHLKGLTNKEIRQQCRRPYATSEFFEMFGNLGSRYFAAKGGATEVELTFPDGVVKSGRSVCFVGDSYEKSRGRSLAIYAALNS